jgi:hypothetical protein
MSTPFSLNTYKTLFSLHVEWHTVNRLILHVQNRNFRDFGLSSVDLKRRNSPCVRCASAANAISSDTGTFNGRSVSVNDLPDSMSLLDKIVLIEV